MIGMMEKPHGGLVRFPYDFQQWKSRKPQLGIVHDLVIRLPVRNTPDTLAVRWKGE